MVRNTNLLCYDLVQANAVRVLVQALQQDVPSVRKAVLFALGNFCAHKEFEEALSQAKFPQLFDELCKSSAADPKYLQRIKKSVCYQSWHPRTYTF